MSLHKDIAQIAEHLTGESRGLLNDVAAITQHKTGKSAGLLDNVASLAQEIAGTSGSLRYNVKMIAETLAGDSRNLRYDVKLIREVATGGEPPAPPTRYTLTINGGIPATSQHPEGAVVRITANPPAGQMFDRWSDGNTTNPREFIMPDHDVTLTAQFIPIPPTLYTLTVNGGTGGGQHAANASVPITATIPSGKQFVRWMVGASTVSTQANFNFTMAAQNTTLDAVFEDIPVPPAANRAYIDFDNYTLTTIEPPLANNMFAIGNTPQWDFNYVWTNMGVAFNPGEFVVGENRIVTQIPWAGSLSAVELFSNDDERYYETSTPIPVKAGQTTFVFNVIYDGVYRINHAYFELPE